MSHQAGRTYRSGVHASVRAQWSLVVDCAAFFGVGVVVPVLGSIAVRSPQLLSETSFSATAGGITLATAFAFVLLRRFRMYAKSGQVAAPLLSVGLPFGVLLGAILAFQLEYSRSLLGASFALNMIVAFFIYRKYLSTAQRRIGLVPLGRCDDENPGSGMHQRIPGPVSGDLSRFDFIVADLDVSFSDEWHDFLARAALQGIPVYHYKEMEERQTGRVQVESLSESSFQSLDPDNLYIPLKYFADKVIAGFALVLASPTLLLIGALIRLDSKGPAIFRQERIGRGEIPFTMYKFRSMYVDGPRGNAATDDDDPRITRVGQFIRRYRIDELPQLINIFRGEMSWIGPRPESVELCKEYGSKISLYAYRHIVKPGISGWAQVNQGNTNSVSQAQVKLEYDFYYTKHLSFWLDLTIVFKTVYVVFSGLGSK